jgi:hypothetical protein
MRIAPSRITPVRFAWSRIAKVRESPSALPSTGVNHLKRRVRGAAALYSRSAESAITFSFGPKRAWSGVRAGQR